MAFQVGGYQVFRNLIGDDLRRPGGGEDGRDELRESIVVDEHDSSLAEVVLPLSVGCDKVGDLARAGRTLLTEAEITVLGDDVGLFDAIRTCRGIRRIKPDPVPDALIRKVCEAGTFAPSGGNRQPWFFIAVTDPERRAFIAEKYRSSFMRYIGPAQTAAAHPSYPDVKRRNMNAAIYLAEHLHEVPVHLFVAGWTRRGQPQSQSLFPAVQNILLACRAVGLGASLTTQHRAFGAEIDEYLGLSEDTPTCALLPIGWPLGKYGRPPRKPVEEVLFFNKVEGPDLNRKQRSG
jgi:nitroreductase